MRLVYFEGKPIAEGQPRIIYLAMNKKEKQSIAGYFSLRDQSFSSKKKLLGCQYHANFASYGLIANRNAMLKHQSGYALYRYKLAILTNLFGSNALSQKSSL